MHYSRILTNLKGRDFEVPATGRGVYLTAFNSDLAECFGVGRELLCYRGPDEMIELIRCYLRRPDECAAIAQRARERCVREHQWSHRIETLLGWLGITAPSERNPGKATTPWG
jgi:spore maturation protein CgeB